MRRKRSRSTGGGPDRTASFSRLGADGAYRAALGCGDGLRHLLRRDRAGLCHSQAYDKGGFPMDRVYIIAIVAAIILLAIHLIRDYGNRE